MKINKLAKQRGQVFIILAVSLAMLAGVVGLAVDSGIGYLVKARLNAAVDAASVAGARAATRGVTQAEQRQAAVTAAEKFFAANYPAGYLGTRTALPGIQVAFDDPRPGRITVDVSAQAAVPVTFMRIAGFNVLDIGASSQTIRKDLDMAFVIDTSGSVSPVGPEVKRQSGAFLDRFSATTDRVSLIHFSNGAEVDAPIRTGRNRGFDRPGMVARINGYKFSGVTNSAEGFWHARNQLNRIAAPDRSSLRVVVFFSDGTPNTFASRFGMRNPAACNRTGAISAPEGNPNSRLIPDGLWDHFKQEQRLSGACSTIAGQLTARALPQWYNARDNAHDFPIVTNTPRLVTNDTSTPTMTYINVNRASKNLVESMAARAREEGIHVFTLGLGPNLQIVTGPGAAPDDTGENLLKCMANTPDAPSRCRKSGSGQPTGVYCHAASAEDLQPCFSMLASEILRITR
ncbi:MAG: hypothetical protein V7642_754 [Burkholderiales bacterium]|jgi:Flp pilus assembly protein TadG